MVSGADFRAILWQPVAAPDIRDIRDGGDRPCEAPTGPCVLQKTARIGKVLAVHWPVAPILAHARGWPLADQKP